MIQHSDILQLSALFETGVARKFINANTAHHFGIPVHPLMDTIHVQALGDQWMSWL